MRSLRSASIVHMRTREERPALTALDRAIIARLQVDGRTPFRAIATPLGVAESTVQRRVEQLMDEGYFKIVGTVNPLRDGKTEATLIALSADMKETLAIATTIADIPEMRYVALVTGTFDVVCEVEAASRTRVNEIITHDLGAIPGVHSMTSSWVLATYKTNVVWETDVALSVNGSDREPVEATLVAARSDGSHIFEVDELDDSIVKILRDNGRTSYVDVASQLGISVSTARRRTARLLDSEYVQVVALGDPHRLGYTFVVLLWIKVELARIKSVLAQLRNEPSVWYLTRVAGAADIVAGALFPDNLGLLSFLDDSLAAIEGIREVSVTLELATYKRSFVRYD
jgi:DNA-binding Lrp family transcriptional regulator